MRARDEQPLGDAAAVAAQRETPRATSLEQTRTPARDSRSPGVAQRNRPAALGRTDDEEIDLRWVAGVGRRRWRLLIAVAGAGVAATAALVLLTPRQYEAGATLALSGPAATGSSNALAVRTVLTSPAVIEAVRTALGTEGLSTALDAGSIFVDVVINTSLVRLRVRMTEPAAASRAAVLLAQRGVAIGRNLRQRDAQAVAAGADVDLLAASRALEDAERAVIQFRQTSRIEVLRAEVEAGLARRARPPAGNLRPQPDAGDVPGLTELYEREMELERLRRALTIAEQVYVAQAVRSRQLQARGTLPAMEMVETTVPAGAPVPREIGRKLALGAVLSLLIAAALAVAAEAWSAAPAERVAATP